MGEARASALRDDIAAAGRIVIEPADTIHERIERVCRAVCKKVETGDIALFQQGRSLLCRVRHDEHAAEAKAVAVSKPASLRTILSRAVVLKLPPAKDGAHPRFVDPPYTGKAPAPEFDAPMLSDILDVHLPELLPELRGVVTAPFMPFLPMTGAPQDVVRPGTDEIVSNPGYHRQS